MKTLVDIPFEIDSEPLMTQCHVEPGSDDASDLEAMIQLAARNGRPKAVYEVAFIEARNNDTVLINGVSFTSRVLAHNLLAVERVFPIVATCGREMDELFPAKGDMLKEFWWDMIKTRVLRAAEKHVLAHVQRVFRLGKTATMRPGSGDVNIWPIQQQQELFALLGDVEGSIGVKLTDSFLMIPNKTISGLLFPTETDFRSCEVCHRDECPSRHAPFNKTLWEAIQHD